MFVLIRHTFCESLAKIRDNKHFVYEQKRFKISKKKLDGGTEQVKLKYMLKITHIPVVAQLYRWKMGNRKC